MIASPEMRRCCGFTMVELLVVIGIIAALIAMLMPALNKARKSALQLQCASNMRQLGQGLVMYQNESKGFIYPGHYVDFSFSPRRSVWGVVVDQKLGGKGLQFDWDAVTLATFACPVNRPEVMAQLSRGSPISSGQTGYVINRITAWSGNIGVDFQTPIRKATSFRNSFEQVYLVETIDENYAIHPANWIPSQRFFGHPNQSGNVLFLDGHVEACSFPKHPIYSATIDGYVKHWGFQL
jgi:prepilin-type processing-associated H-X9-DG protein/prepilin-type N-terminal cleavage/methylation domain-containing protein